MLCSYGSYLRRTLTKVCTSFHLDHDDDDTEERDADGDETS